MHNNVIIGLSVLTAFTLSIMLALYGMRFLDRDRQWRPRRYGVSAREMPCSFCGKLVREEAIVCRHCHHRLDEVVEGGGDEMPEGGAADPVGALQPSDKRLAPAAAAAAASEVVVEDLSNNQAFVWLDNAFAQLAVKEAPAVWGATLANREIAQPSLSVEPSAASTDPLQSELARKNEMVVRAIGPLSEQPGLNARSTKTWFSDWRPRKEWAFAAGIAFVALIVGGSTFLVGPSKSPVEHADDYVTFDVSERAPLYTGPESKAEAPAAAKAVATTTADSPAVAAKPEATAAPSRPAVPQIALPEMPQVPVVEKATDAPTSLASIEPPQSAAKSDPAASAPPREEDWASLVTRAVKPAPSNDLVVAVQRLIRAEGYDPGMIDGIVGERTRRAIRAYQRNGGLAPTGQIDNDLLTKLNLAGRTVRVVGPLSGVAPPVRSTSAKPIVEWKK